MIVRRFHRAGHRPPPAGVVPYRILSVLLLVAVVVAPTLIIVGVVTQPRPWVGIDQPPAAARPPGTAHQPAKGFPPGAAQPAPLAVDPPSGQYRAATTPRKNAPIAVVTAYQPPPESAIPASTPEPLIVVEQIPVPTETVPTPEPSPEPTSCASAPKPKKTKQPKGETT